MEVAADLYSALITPDVKVRSWGSALIGYKFTTIFVIWPSDFNNMPDTLKETYISWVSKVLPLKLPPVGGQIIHLN